MAFHPIDEYLDTARLCDAHVCCRLAGFPSTANSHRCDGGFRWRWLFYVQHQFEETHWSRKEVWNREDAALYGSSYYDLPKPIMWLTANIGIHHVHHVSANVPFFRLPEIVRDYPELRKIGRLSFRESLRCVPLTLWDEAKKELISFLDLSRRRLEADAT